MTEQIIIISIFTGIAFVISSVMIWKKLLKTKGET